MRPKTYTMKAEKTLHSIITPGSICKAYDHLGGEPHPKILDIKMLWDTGASISLITEKVIKELGLKPVSTSGIIHAQGRTIADIYYIHVILPNGIEISNIKATSGNLEDADALIGMDVISLCGIAITNVKGKTQFSFEIPSEKEIVF